jgi:uncharacterized protein with LGFP repeats
MAELGVNLITCDHEKCVSAVAMNVRDGFVRPDAALKHAEGQGWVRDSNGEDFCPQHVPSAS